MWLHDPGLLTKIIPAMVMPRSMSSESRRLFSCLVIGLSILFIDFDLQLFFVYGTQTYKSDVGFRSFDVGNVGVMLDCWCLLLTRNKKRTACVDCPIIIWMKDLD